MYGDDVNKKYLEFISKINLFTLLPNNTDIFIRNAYFYGTDVYAAYAEEASIDVNFLYPYAK
jgi:hypothetical protein